MHVLGVASFHFTSSFIIFYQRGDKFVEDECLSLIIAKAISISK